MEKQGTVDPEIVSRYKMLEVLSQAASVERMDRQCFGPRCFFRHRVYLISQYNSNFE